jgi:hypothetical protein
MRLTPSTVFGPATTAAGAGDYRRDPNLIQVRRLLFGAARPMIE